MKTQILLFVTLCSTFAGAYERPANGAYKVTGGGLTKTTCPAEDIRPVSQLPWWTVKTVGLDSINIRESVNLYSTYQPTSKFGFFPLKSIGYGSYQGSGYVLRKEPTAFGPCNMRRDITAKVNVYGTDLTLEATVVESFLDGVFDPPACAKIDRVACSYSFNYDLSLADPER